ncbi:MAG: hypothetical protein AAFR65_13320 [Pseudomonadota bacterium]
MTDQEFLVVQAAALAVILSLFVGTAFFQLKPEHLIGRKSVAVLGAGLFGLMFGLVVVTAILPFRVEGQGDDAPPWLPALAFAFFVLRSDRIAMLPLIGPPLRAYRAASLRRTITQSRQRLDKLGIAGDTAGSNPEE